MFRSLTQPSPFLQLPFHHEKSKLRCGVEIWQATLTGFNWPLRRVAVAREDHMLVLLDTCAETAASTWWLNHKEHKVGHQHLEKLGGNLKNGIIPWPKFYNNYKTDQKHVFWCLISKVAVAGRCWQQRWSYYIHWSSSHLRPRIVKLILSDHCRRVWFISRGN